jgi:exopolysaccharide biosynthesis protein
MPDPKANKKRKRLPIWAIVVIDVLVTAMILGGFMLYYFILPRAQEPLNIVVSNPNTGAETQPPAESTPVPADTDDATQTAEPEPEEPAVLTWAEKFSDHFTDTVVATDTSYSSPNISFTIEKVVTGEGRDTVTYYVADIYIADIECFQTYMAENTYGKGYKEEVPEMDIASGALLAMTGDFYGYQDEGVVIRNGVVYRADETDLDICVLYYDGTVETFSPEEFNLDEAVAKGAYQGWTFGPSLLDENGNVPEDYKAKQKLKDLNPRSGFGFIEPGHYCFVVVDGRDRGYSRGVTLEEYSQIFKDLGCVAAYNFDGGESAVMTYNDEMVNIPFDDGRPISDIVLLKEVGE